MCTLTKELSGFDIHGISKRLLDPFIKSSSFFSWATNPLKVWDSAKSESIAFLLILTKFAESPLPSDYPPETALPIQPVLSPRLTICPSVARSHLPRGPIGFPTIGREFISNIDNSTTHLPISSSKNICIWPFQLFCKTQGQISNGYLQTIRGLT